MTALSNDLETKLINATLRGTTYTSPTTVYLALFTTSASLAELEAGTLTNEVTGGSYVRKAVTFDAPTNGVTQNSANVTFSGMPAVTVGFAATMDALSGGNVMFYAPLAANKVVGSGDTIQVDAGQFTSSLA